MVDGDDGRRSRPGDHVGRGRRLARAGLRESPAHRRRLRGGQSAALRRVIPGSSVSHTVRQKSLADPSEPAFYVSLTQLPLRRTTAVVAMSPSGAASGAGAIEQAIRADVRKINPTMAVDFQLASDVVGGTIRRQELGM